MVYSVPMTKKWNKLRNAVRDALGEHASEQQRIAYEKCLHADKLLEGNKRIKKAKDAAGNYSQKSIVDDFKLFNTRRATGNPAAKGEKCASRFSYEPAGHYSEQT